jgi:hypothetical protein
MNNIGIQLGLATRIGIPRCAATYYQLQGTSKT